MGTIEPGQIHPRSPGWETGDSSDFTPVCGLPESKVYPGVGNGGAAYTIMSNPKRIFGRPFGRVGCYVAAPETWRGINDYRTTRIGFSSSWIKLESADIKADPVSSGVSRSRAGGSSPQSLPSAVKKVFAWLRASRRGWK